MGSWGVLDAQLACFSEDQAGTFRCKGQNIQIKSLDLEPGLNLEPDHNMEADHDLETDHDLEPDKNLEPDHDLEPDHNMGTWNNLAWPLPEHQMQPSSLSMLLTKQCQSQPCPLWISLRKQCKAHPPIFLFVNFVN